MTSKSEVANPFLHPFLFLYQLIQWVIGQVLSPNPPKDNVFLHRPKIAIIGAGITGVTAAAHCVGHGFDVVIFEAGDEKQLGGIWSWEKGYPDRKQIVEQVRMLWKRYGLDKKTRFNVKIDKVYKDDRERWVLNDTSNGHFEGLIAAIGTCGEAKMPHISGMDKFKGEILHSSELTGYACTDYSSFIARPGLTRADRKNAKGKKIAIIGGGASAVEALEFAAAAKAEKTSILSRSDKWIIPRNIIVDTLLSLNIFGQETALSFIPEFLLRKFFYRDLEDIAPADVGIFMDTPMVNSDVMQKLRDGEAEWVRGDIQGFKENGVLMNRRAKGVPKGGPGHEELVEADMVIMATGFKRPSLSFLPNDCFEEPYEPPNWYLQTFPTQHPSVSAINCTYVSAIGSVGNWHIGIYTRILLMFLADPLSRPSPTWMRRWIDMTKLFKRSSPTGAFDFFTYLELVWWFFFCVCINPFRWKWAIFVFTGVGIGLPRAFVNREEKLLNGEGYHVRDKGSSL